jgi:hypothetical protein
VLGGFWVRQQTNEQGGQRVDERQLHAELWQLVDEPKNGQCDLYQHNIMVKWAQKPTENPS